MEIQCIRQVVENEVPFNVFLVFLIVVHSVHIFLLGVFWFKSLLISSQLVVFMTYHNQYYTFNFQLSSILFHLAMKESWSWITRSLSWGCLKELSVEIGYILVTYWWIFRGSISTMVISNPAITHYPIIRNFCVSPVIWKINWRRSKSALRMAIKVSSGSLNISSMKILIWYLRKFIS